MLDNLWDSKEKRLKKLREKSQAMTEEELLEYGRSCRRLAAVRVVSYEPNPWIERLQERKEWRRRHPK